MSSNFLNFQIAHIEFFVLKTQYGLHYGVSRGHRSNMLGITVFIIYVQKKAFHHFKLFDFFVHSAVKRYALLAGDHTCSTQVTKCKSRVGIKETTVLPITRQCTIKMTLKLFL